MKVRITYSTRDKKHRATEFTGTNAERDGLLFIAYGQPMTVHAVSIVTDEPVDADEVEDLSYHEQEA